MGVDSWNGSSDLQVILICDQYIGWRWRRPRAFRVTISCLDTVSVVGYIRAILLARPTRKPKYTIFAIIMADIKKALVSKKRTNPAIKVLVEYYKYLDIFL